MSHHDNGLLGRITEMDGQPRRVGLDSWFRRDENA